MADVVTPSPHIEEAIRCAVKASRFRLQYRGRRSSPQERRYAETYSRMATRALARACPPDEPEGAAVA